MHWFFSQRGVGTRGGNHRLGLDLQVCYLADPEISCKLSLTKLMRSIINKVRHKVQFIQLFGYMMIVPLVGIVLYC